MKKRILLGISGGIATYKICDLVRMLKKKKYQVHVVMTAHAKKFVSPLTFKTLTEQPVFSDMFAENDNSAMPHISLSMESDLMIIAPATANIISKIAHAIGDDLLSTLCLSFPNKIIIAPAMNFRMYENPLFQENLEKLKRYKEKYIIAGPETGDLACGEGVGRLIEITKLLKIIEDEIKK